MKKHKRIVIWVIIFSFLFILFVPYSIAKGKGGSSGSTKGYCCKNGLVSSSSKSKCLQQDGSWYPSQFSAKSNCKPNTEYCCAKGKVSEISPDKCKKYGGKSYASKTSAVKACQDQDIYCCLNGDVDKISPTMCKKKGGKGYTSKSMAQRACEPEDIYCCRDGNVEKISPKRCKAVRGIIYDNRAEASRACGPKEIYCCLDGDVYTVSAEECKTKGGNGYKSSSLAMRNCGWCCDSNNRVFSASPDQCRRKRGEFYSSRVLAEKECREKPKCCINGELFSYSKLICKGKKGHYYGLLQDAEKKCQQSSKIVFAPRYSIGEQETLKQKKGLFWCCANGKVTKEMSKVCQKVGGSLHKTEEEANSACSSKGSQYVNKDLDLKEIGFDRNHLLGSDGKLSVKHLERATPEPLNDGGEGAQWTGQSGQHNGIGIVEPKNQQQVHRGTAIRVSYRLTADLFNIGRRDSSKIIKFYLFSGVNNFEEPLAYTTHKHTLGRSGEGSRVRYTLGRSTEGSRVHSFYWNLPSSLPVDDNYRMKAWVSDTIWDQSSRFSIVPLENDSPLDLDLAGDSGGFVVELPRGGETFRPGDTISSRWRQNSDYLPPQEMEVFLAENCSFQTTPSTRLNVVSGNPAQPQSEFTVRIPDHINDGQYCLNLRADDYDERHGITPTRYGFSRLFFISQNPIFGDRAILQGGPTVRVITAGVHDEHWSGESGEVKWQFQPGGTGILPGSWTITFVPQDASSGDMTVQTFTAQNINMRQISQGGLPWWEYSVNQRFNLALGKYKIRVKGMEYQAGSERNLMVHRSFNLKVSGLGLQARNLIISEGSVVEGDVDFLVQAGERSKKVTIETRGRVPFRLGELRDFADLSQHSCGIPFRVTVDPDNRIDGESNENDNTYEETVYHLRHPEIDVSADDGSTVQLNDQTSPAEEVFSINFRNCSPRYFYGYVRVVQSGSWSDPIPGTLGHTEPRFHDELKVYGNHVGIGNGSDFRISIKKQDLVKIADSEIKIYFTADLAPYVSPNPYQFHLDIRN